MQTDLAVHIIISDYKSKWIRWNPEGNSQRESINSIGAQSTTIFVWTFVSSGGQLMVITWASSLCGVAEFHVDHWSHHRDSEAKTRGWIGLETSSIYVLLDLLRRVSTNSILQKDSISYPTLKYIRWYQSDWAQWMTMDDITLLVSIDHIITISLKRIQ